MESKKIKAQKYYKLYYQQNKEVRDKLSREYYKKNHEHLKIKHAEYRKNNKIKIKNNNKIKIMCICGILISKINKSRHCKTKKHLSKIVN